MKKLRSFKNPFKELYDEADLPKVIRRSLTLMLCGNLCGNMHGIICGSGTTAMVGLATRLGADDLTFGILTSIAQFAAIMQIPFSLLVNRTHKRKKYLLTYGLFSRALWLLFGFIPFIVPETSGININLQLWALIFMLGVICCCGAAIQVSWFPWLSDIAPLTIRSRWLATRDVILSVANIVCGFVVALLLDNLPEETKYIIIFIIGGVIGMIDMLCFAGCKEQYSAPPKKLHLGKVIGDVFRNKQFMRFTILWTAWNFTANMGGVYMTPYSMNVMGLNNTQIMVFATIASSLASILFIQKWGKALYRYGGKCVLLVSCTVASCTPLFYLFSSPGNIFPTLLHNVIGAAFWCGSNLAATSMQLSCSPDDERPSYVAVFSCITAIVGVMLGSLAGGTFLDLCSSHNWFAGWLDRYKALFVIEVILRLGATWIFVPKLENDSDRTPKQLVMSILNIKRRFS